MNKRFLVAICASLIAACSASAAGNMTPEESQYIAELRTSYAKAGKEWTPVEEVKWLAQKRAIDAIQKDPNLSEVDRYHALMSVINNSPLSNKSAAATDPVATAAPAVVTSTISEADLRKQLDPLAKARKPVLEVTYMRDGISFEGQRFADPEGTASHFVVDNQTGRVGYTIATPGAARVKLVNLANPTESVTLGQVTQNRGQWQFTSVTGKTLAGDLFFTLTDGVLLLRDSVGFKYTAGEGVKQIQFPNGWYPAPLQHGNISTTGWLLLEKDLSEEKKSSLSAFYDLGKMVGLKDGSEYALLNIATGKTVPIGISASGKNAYSYSGCKKKGLANQCANVTSFESAFSPDGSPNPTHYFWNVQWLATATGPILLVKEGTLGSQLNAWDLDSGKKVNLFERTLGVNSFNPKLTADGHMNLTVQMGFSSDQIEDVGAEIQKRAPL